MNERVVLIVDDDRIMRLVMRDVLEAAGYEAPTLHRATNVPAAIEAHGPELVILDVLMPERSGLEVVGILAGIGCTVPLIIVTALPLTLDSVGGHRVLLKPFQAAELLGAVEAIIGPARRCGREVPHGQ